jgi:hypothetical protein
MKTQVFVYGGYLGVSSHPETEGLVAATGLGIVINSQGLEISQEAIDVLRKARKAGGSYAPLQVFAGPDKSVIFGWEGSWKSIFPIDEVQLGRDDDPSLLQPSEVEVPQDFRDFVDKQPA